MDEHKARSEPTIDPVTGWSGDGKGAVAGAVASGAGSSAAAPAGDAASGAAHLAGPERAAAPPFSAAALSAVGLSAAELAAAIAGAPGGEAPSSPSICWPPDVPLEPHGLNLRVGHYELRREIAAGGMGAVFEAVQDQPRRPVALKLLRSGSSSAASLRRFENEAQHLARLQHPNIAQVYEAGTYRAGERAIPYIAMEYVAGARWITDFAVQRQLTRRQRLDLFAQVCDAVHHGHQKGIIHRDLKPGNILVDSSGRAKVIDFGVSRALDADPTSLTIATEGPHLVGTLQYMSPEQCDPNVGDVGVPSDVYALGVVLYELLCGRLPYDVTGTNLAHTVLVIRERPPTRPTLFDRSLRGDLETILLKALHKSPQRRYASAADLGEDVRRVLRGEPILARADSVAYVLATRAKTLIARHQITTAVLACIVAVILTNTLGEQLIVEWTPLHRIFVSRIARLFPPNAPDLMSKVRIVTYREGTDMEALAASVNVAGVRAEDPRSRRLLYGKLAEVLSKSGAWVVVFDTCFEEESEHDPKFAEGLRVLRENKIEVVVAQWRWDQVPKISKQLLPYVRWGAITIDNGNGTLPWHLLLFALPDRNSEPLPSLALVALAAYRLRELDQIGAEISWESDVDFERVAWRYYRRDPSAPQVRIPIGVPEAVRATTAIQMEGDGADIALKPEAIVGPFHVEVASDELIRSGRLDLDLADVLRAKPEELREWFQGRVVVIGRADAAANDLHPYMDGRMLPGCYAHAFGIDKLLRGEGQISYYVRHGSINLSELWAMEFAGAGLGIAAVVLGGVSLLRRSIYLALMAVGIAMLSLLTYGQLRYLWNPLFPITAMVVAALLMSRATAVRRRVFG